MAETPVHQLLRRLPLAVILVAAVTGAILWRAELAPSALAARAGELAALRDANYALAVGLFMLVYVAVVALSLPGATLCTLLGGLVFGTFPGMAFNVAAASTGAVLLFLAVRAGIGAELADRALAGGGRAGRVVAELQARPWWALISLRLLPVVPFFAANLLPALAGVRLWPFWVTTVFGILPGAFLLTSLGEGFGAVIAAGGMPDMAQLTSARVLVPLALGGALAGGVALWRRRERGRP